MRIIAGKWKGRIIAAPRGTDTTRPTADRVREALFSILLPRLHGARVLDLFAGSGALGLEAVSRGAELAYLVDSDSAACAAIRKNIENLSAGDAVRLIQRDTFAAIPHLAGAAFDIVFLDPPYRQGLLEKAAHQVLRGGLLEQDGVVVAESAAVSPPGAVPGLVIASARRYGATLLTIYEREGCV